ncbi:MAG: YncE family protein [Burkholderiales bacterium]|nr:YncE family protein [Burkholderiales bacterium]
MAFAALAAAGCLALAPAEPGRPPALRLDRYIELPRAGLLSALDDMTVARGHLFVTSLSSGALLDVDLARTAGPLPVRSMGGGGAAHGVAIQAAAGVGFVTRGGLDAVDAFELGSLRPLQRIATPAGPDAALYDPASGLVYVACAEARQALLIDADRRRPVATIALPGRPEYAALDAATGFIYQNLADRQAMAVIDPRSRRLLGVQPLAHCEDPTGLALDSAGRHAFVVCSGSRRLAVVDLRTDETVAALEIGPLSDSVAYDPGLRRVYVASGSGRLTVIGQDAGGRWRVVQRIATRLGAHTLTLDPQTHRVYVGYAGLLGRPRIAVFEPVPPGAGPAAPPPR